MSPLALRKPLPAGVTTLQTFFVRGVGRPGASVPVIGSSLATCVFMSSQRLASGVLKSRVPFERSAHRAVSGAGVDVLTSVPRSRDHSGFSRCSERAIARAPGTSPLSLQKPRSQALAVSRVAVVAASGSFTSSSRSPSGTAGEPAMISPVSGSVACEASANSVPPSGVATRPVNACFDVMRSSCRPVAMSCTTSAERAPVAISAASRVAASGCAEANQRP